MPRITLKDRNESVDHTIGLRVREQRTLKGMSQSALSDVLGITFQQVQKYERGTNRLAASTLVLIADTLDVPVIYFYGADTDAAPAAAPDPIMHRRETLELVRAYYRMPAKVRKHLVRMVRSMAANAALTDGKGQ